MLHRVFRFVAAVLTVAAVQLPVAARDAAAAELKVGDTAPDFELLGSDGKTYKLSDFKGKQAVVVAWFPKAFTGGCTAECKSFKAERRRCAKYHVAYFTASVDHAEGEQEVRRSRSRLDYPILSDPGQDRGQGLRRARRQTGLPSRWTFYIDKTARSRRSTRQSRPTTRRGRRRREAQGTGRPGRSNRVVFSACQTTKARRTQRKTIGELTVFVSFVSLW